MLWPPPAEATAPRAGPDAIAILGGFECATHRTLDGRQIDSIAASHHDTHAGIDYALVREAGIGTVRDGLRWHLIESAPGVYDWSSVARQAEAAAHHGVGVIWDLCHWGWPPGIDIFAPAFVDRFVAFAAAAVRHLAQAGARPAGVVPVNEISFWAWAGGEHPGFAPHGRGQGDALKRQLVRAFLAGAAAVRAVDPTIPILCSEPLVVMHPNPGRASARSLRNARSGIAQAWDMLLGRREPELGGHAQGFDVLGLNWYPENQWRHMGRMLPLDDPRRVSLTELLVRLDAIYRKPMLLTETGREQPHGPSWLAATLRDCRRARAAGADLRGVCIYPVMDYAGWDDARHCPCGLIELARDWQHRRLRPDMLAAVAATGDRGFGSAAADRGAAAPFPSVRSQPWNP